jgi:hypothetical protein
MRVAGPTPAIDLVRTFQDETRMDDRAIVVLLCEFIDERQLASAFYEHLANAMEWEKDITHSRRRSR